MQAAIGDCGAKSSTELLIQQMAKRKNRVFALLAVGVFGLIVGIALSRLWQDDNTQGRRELPFDAALSLRTDSGNEQSAESAARYPIFQDADSGEPLPPADVPVREVLAELQQRARAGEAKAACRIAHEKTQCSTLPYRRLLYERWLASTRRGIDLMGSKHIEQYTKRIEFEDGEHRASLERLAHHCAGIDNTDALDSVELWRRAALMGSPYAVRLYASGRVFQMDRILDLSGQLVLWRSEAPRLAFSAAEQGDLAMTLILAGALSPFPDGSEAFLAQAMEQDGPLSLALYRRAHGALVAAFSRVNDPEDEFFIASETRSWDIQRWIDDLSYFLGAEGMRRADELERTRLANWQSIIVPQGVTNMTSWGNASVPRATECGKTMETESGGTAD